MTGSIVSVDFFRVMSNQETNRVLTVAVANGESYCFLGIHNRNFLIQKEEANLHNKGSFPTVDGRNPKQPPGMVLKPCK